MYTPRVHYHHHHHPWHLCIQQGIPIWGAPVTVMYTASRKCTCVSNSQPTWLDTTCVSRYWTNESYENTHKTIHLLHFGRNAPVSVIHLVSRKRPGWTVVWTQHNTTQTVVMKNGGWQGGRVDVSNVNLVGKRHRFLNDFFGVSWWNFLESHGLSAWRAWKTKSSRPDGPKAGRGPGGRPKSRVPTGP